MPPFKPFRVGNHLILWTGECTVCGKQIPYLDDYQKSQGMQEDELAYTPCIPDESLEESIDE